MFQCHVIVEPCISRVGGIKSLFEFASKGNNSVTVQMVRINKLTMKLDISKSLATSLHPKHFENYFYLRSLIRILLLPAWMFICKNTTPCTFEEGKRTDRWREEGSEQRLPSGLWQSSCGQVLLRFTTQIFLSTLIGTRA